MNRATIVMLAFCVASNTSAMARPMMPITGLELKEPSGVSRTNWPVTTGVPLPEGALKNPGDAVLLEPAPVPAGQKVRFPLEGLPAGRLFFAVKSFDEQSNISDLSNVVEVEIRETRP